MFTYICNSAIKGTWSVQFRCVSDCTMLSLDRIPELRATATYCFNQSQLSPLLDLIGPLPQGRRLFGPTVVESRQPSRILDFLRSLERTGRWQEYERTLVCDSWLSKLKQPLEKGAREQTFSFERNTLRVYFYFPMDVSILTNIIKTDIYFN